ncbi:uncharacterized protein LOC131161612 isoform X2 [Malania oleifera]|uniref:uncharacterized protein LOC131161612 isoform X2 n=1 Tax=Malania oleifera TaxID=397392 RepID=UPI0025AE96E8|nr:uncharacterized protein LOC131161612 isoform X2 [Malania oleifera]
MLEKKLLDLPKLLDICAIYGHENQDLTRSLVMNALKAQPGIHDGLTAVLFHFLHIVHTMHQRCSSSLEALSSSGGLEEHGSSQLHADFLEVMDFINDAIASMDAFVSVYKPAAVIFSCPVEMSYGNEELLIALARLHDSLLPSLQRGFQMIVAARGGLQNAFGVLTDVAVSLKMLSVRIANLGWRLLDICHLSNEMFDGSFSLPAATKMFPANVEDPVVRADILIQTFRDVNGVAQPVPENQNRVTFLQNIEKNCKIMSRLENLRDNGWIFLDDEQFQFLSGIMHPLKPIIKNQPSAQILASNKLQTDEDAAIIESKISQIRDLFPDYGKGFLSACLEVYNQNPEEVIQRILEGTLHEDLQSLDTSLEKIPQPKSSSSLGRNDKGKGKVSEFTALPSADVAGVDKKQQTQGASFSSSSSVGRYTRKPKNDLPDSETLNSKDERDSAKTAALVSQYEYEDEYDDSFDDLGLSVVESGLEETEILGDRISSNMSLETQTESPAQHGFNSKWGSRKKPQFFVKDGKNYSYKIAGSVAVANYNEASLVNQAQKELIHGLGRGGNLPLGAVKKLTESSEEQDDQPDVSEMAGRGSRGNSRGRGRRGGGRSHYKKDQAFKKHFSGLGGY